MKKSVRIAALFAALLLCAGLLQGCAVPNGNVTEPTEHPQESEPIETPCESAAAPEISVSPVPTQDPNLAAVDLGEYRLEASGADDFPYLVRTPHIVWHIAADDMELLGKETYFAGLRKVLEVQEADIEDAIEALSGYLSEIPVINVYTDFSGRTPKGKAGKTLLGYYMGNRIDLYVNFSVASMALLHEYAHYLTLSCSTLRFAGGFWSEGIAEYLSRFVCKNRMARAAFSPEEVELYAKYGMTDADGNPDLGRIYRCGAESFRSGTMNGTSYYSVGQTNREMTQEQQEHPTLGSISYYEAGCFFNWLVERYGRDFVFTHLKCRQDEFADVFGEDFEILFIEWAAENRAWCEENGVQTVFSGQ